MMMTMLVMMLLMVMMVTMVLVMAVVVVVQGLVRAAEGHVVVAGEAPGLGRPQCGRGSRTC